MLIVPGPASRELADKVSTLIQVKSIAVESKVFPDGESYIRFLGSVQGEDVAIIQSTYPPQDRHLIQLFLMIGGLRDLGCSRIYCVVPYLAYMRQDKRFLEGEMVSGRSVLGFMQRLGVDRLITVDVHSRAILDSFKPEARDLTAMTLIADWIKARGFKAPLIISPDKGAVDRARLVSEALDTDYAVGKKTRDRVTGAVTSEFGEDLNVNGRHAIIVDELIARGDTVIKSAEILLKRGAVSVSAICTHGLYLDDALTRMRSAGVQEVVSTDTIPSTQTRISVAPIVAEALRPLAA